MVENRGDALSATFLLRRAGLRLFGWGLNRSATFG
jgi:hypothetical protein